MVWRAVKELLGETQVQLTRPHEIICGLLLVYEGRYPVSYEVQRHFHFSVMIMDIMHLTYHRVNRSLDRFAKGSKLPPGPQSQLQHRPQPVA